MMKNDTCKHFTGTQHDQCAKGLSYDSVRVLKEGGGAKFPCLRSPEVACPHREYPTQEEIAAHQVEVEGSFNRMIKAINAIREKVGPWKKGCGQHGMIPCPTCGKPLHFSIAHFNGHIHARCSTLNCVSFMQ